MANENPKSDESTKSDANPKSDANRGPLVSIGGMIPARTARQRLQRLALGLCIIAGVFLAWELLTAFVAYTDDAYVASDLVAVAPQVSGAIVSLKAENNRDVHKGDLLAVIDDAPFRLDVAARKAALDAATAAAAAEQDAAGPQRAIRAATVAEARAALDLADWRLAQTEIRAPVDGTVNNLAIGVGETATAGKPLIGIVAAGNWHVIANYKENYVASLKPGQTAWVWLDTHPWHLYRARIDGIARAVSRREGAGGGDLLPYVAPTTDWIRLKRRFPVTLSFVDPPPGLDLYMGADASVVVLP